MTIVIRCKVKGAAKEIRRLYAIGTISNLLQPWQLPSKKYILMWYVKHDILVHSITLWVCLVHVCVLFWKVILIIPILCIIYFFNVLTTVSLPSTSIRIMLLDSSIICYLSVAYNMDTILRFVATNNFASSSALFESLTVQVCRLYDAN